MAARRNLKAKPKEYLVDPATWPDGPLKEPKPEVEFLMEIAQRLKAQVDAKSNRGVARAAGIDPQTVINIIKGDTWCEVPTIFRLEKPPRKSLAPNPPQDIRQTTTTPHLTSKPR
jgi:hypothetical protein